MAPNLPETTLDLIHDMFIDVKLSLSQMAANAGCSKPTIIAIRSNLRIFGSVRAPPVKSGRPRRLTTEMMDALCDHLLEEPALYLHEMQVFLLDELTLHVSNSSISDALHRKGWSKKTAREKAKERNADLRDECFHNTAELRLYQLIFVDESGCDKRIGTRRTGWSPLGVTPRQDTTPGLNTIPCRTRSYLDLRPLQQHRRNNHRQYTN